MKITLEHREGSDIYYAWLKRNWWERLIGGRCIAAGYGRDETLKRAIERLNEQRTLRPRRIHEDVEVFRVEP